LGGVAAADWPEAYVGVFSNKRPEWLSSDEDHDADVYAERLQHTRDTPPDNNDDLKKRWPQIWADPLPKDYFADKDWNVEGDNIWIIQVGNKTEYGDFQQFKDRVRTAKVTIDDVGDLECTYHMPTPLTEGGGSQALTLKYGDNGEFTLDGAPVQTDLYPRFESPYIRGVNAFPLNNRVEWGQRAYTIEYNGKTLTHDFVDFDFTAPDTKPVRSQTNPQGDPDTVRALVIFPRTGEEEMEESTIGAATVSMGCHTAVDDEIIAVGPVDENTDHDAEWIFFDQPAALTPDLTIELAHRAFGDGDDDAEWDVSYTIKALMADHQLYDCALSFSSVHFTDDTRRSGLLPLAVKTNRWRPWQDVPDSRMTGAVTLVKRPPWRQFYYDHCDLLVAAPDLSMSHRRIQACLDAPAVWSHIPGPSGGPQFSDATAVQAFSRSPGHIDAFAVSAAQLFTASVDPNTQWSPWVAGTDLTADFPPDPVPLASPGALHAAATITGAELVATGADGHLYASYDWQLGGLNMWRKLKVTGFVLDQHGPCVLANDTLFVTGADGSLWAAPIDRSPLAGAPSWTKLSLPDVAVRTFTVVDESSPTRLLAIASDGQVWDVAVPFGAQPQWVLIGAPAGQRVPPGVRIACASPDIGRLDIVVLAAAAAYTRTWTSSGWGPWQPITNGDQGFRAADNPPMLIQRINRQLELLVETVDGDLKRAWWT